MKLITLTQGKFAQVDDEDFEYLNQFKWFAHKKVKDNTFYASRTVHIPRSENTEILRTASNRIYYKSKSIKMHRDILNLVDPKIKGDHIDHNGLNNQRSNLRVATHKENCRNKKACGLSKYLGVAIKNNHYGRQWRVAISLNGKNKSIGSFPFTPEGEIKAAKKYDEFAKKYYKEFANLNFK